MLLAPKACVAGGVGGVGVLAFAAGGRLLAGAMVCGGCRLLPSVAVALAISRWRSIAVGRAAAAVEPLAGFGAAAYWRRVRRAEARGIEQGRKWLGVRLSAALAGGCGHG